jgi:prevent-host-death family protein
MPAKSIGAAKFKAECLHLLDEVARNGESLTITKRGKPIAVLSPVARENKPTTLFGALAGTVLRYDDPFGPATDPMDWEANR